MSVAFSRWPERYVWSFQVTRLLGLADFGGSDVTEVLETCDRISLDDNQSWDRAWLQTAELVEERGRRAEAQGNWISARNFYQRATNYYRAAQFFLVPKNPDRLRILRKIDEVFEAAARYLPVAPEKVFIPYEGKELPGYLWRVPNAVATVIQLNGGDEISSENWFTAGSTFVEAGYNYFVFEGPGVGLTLLEKRVPRRPDTEHYVGPAIDFLESRNDWVQTPYVLVGTSFGSFDVLRAASFEKRTAAAIASSPAYRLDWANLVKWMSPEFREYAHETVGAKDLDELVNDPQFGFSLEGALPHMSCPLLLIQGDEELLVQPTPLSQFLRIYEEAGTENKKMVFVEKSGRLGGIEHCQKDNVHLQHDIWFNWLGALGLGPAPRAAA
ncbi:alpha/beta hydrolase family protein [Cryptosporangium sp. NPDC051539]|uniref:alpha/beta hydrolase family protein n=1 Tax=Cryptosporangium sp. NPDC051539 TaxID=3363962 RepID=UPI0037A564AE